MRGMKGNRDDLLLLKTEVLKLVRRELVLSLVLGALKIVAIAVIIVAVALGARGVLSALLVLVAVITGAIWPQLDGPRIVKAIKRYFAVRNYIYFLNMELAESDSEDENFDEECEALLTFIEYDDFNKNNY